MDEFVIAYPHIRNHEHHINLCGLNLSILKDVPDFIEFLPIEINNTLDD